jgi:hypothetical protein
MAHVNLWNYARRAIAQVNSGKKGQQNWARETTTMGTFELSIPCFDQNKPTILLQRFSKEFKNNDESGHLHEGEHG